MPKDEGSLRGINEAEAGTIQNEEIYERAFQDKSTEGRSMLTTKDCCFLETGPRENAYCIWEDPVWRSQNKLEWR